MTERKAKARAKEEADPYGMTARKAEARARTGGSRFLAALGMTISFRNCQREARATALR
jgi:hypothetical protein